MCPCVGRVLETCLLFGMGMDKLVGGRRRELPVGVETRVLAGDL